VCSSAEPPPVPQGLACVSLRRTFAGAAVMPNIRGRGASSASCGSSKDSGMHPFAESAQLKRVPLS
jgi:hypothetical protein